MEWLDGVIESKLAVKQYQSKSCTEQDKIKITELIISIKRDGLLEGIGKPEILKHYDPSKYSRRVNKRDRMIYDALLDESSKKYILRIHTYKFHYDL